MRRRYRNPIDELLVKELEDQDEQVQKRRRKAFFVANQKAIKEQEEIKKYDTCPKCHVMLTTMGTCPYGHDI